MAKRKSATGSLPASYFATQEPSFPDDAGDRARIAMPKMPKKQMTPAHHAARMTRR